MRTPWAQMADFADKTGSNKGKNPIFRDNVAQNALHLDGWFNWIPDSRFQIQDSRFRILDPRDWGPKYMHIPACRGLAGGNPVRDKGKRAAVKFAMCI